MIIGSGLLAQAFAPAFSHREDVCIYAAGVSNSGCADKDEFAREYQRLADTLQQVQEVDAFVYFGTCSVDDPEMRDTAYVQHKLDMERLASTHPRYLILRLPQVAGRTQNPHTLLNFLYARIARSEAFSLWKNARRNIIDVDDVVAISIELIDGKLTRNTTINVANPVNYSMADIVSAMEHTVGKPAIYDVVERGYDYPVCTCTILPILDNAAVKFGDGYLERVINKYYGKDA